MMADSDMFRPCEPGPTSGSCFSVLGELRGEAVRNVDECAEEGVGKSVPVLGERLVSAALRGVEPADVADAGVVS